MTGSARIISVALDEAGLPAPTPELDQERRVAMFDLTENSFFAPMGAAPGPYRLHLALEGHRLTLTATPEAGGDGFPVVLSLAPLRQTIRDYGAICQTYFAAVNHQPLAQIEALDAGRRAIHAAGADALDAMLAPQVKTDAPTRRRLFSLIAVLLPPG